jgi:simple sugar transport system permease protein
MVTDGSLTGFTGSDGFNGIVVALFGGLNPIWTIVSAFVFAGLIVGGDVMQVVTNVPADLITTLEGLVVVFVVSLEYLRRRARTFEAAEHRRGAAAAEHDALAAEAAPPGRAV